MTIKLMSIKYRVHLVTESNICNRK